MAPTTDKKSEAPQESKRAESSQAVAEKPDSAEDRKRAAADYYAAFEEFMKIKTEDFSLEAEISKGADECPKKA
ncbi:hypothetical protein V2A60_009812 [Cordyceps javanica]